MYVLKSIFFVAKLLGIFFLELTTQNFFPINSKNRYYYLTFVVFMAVGCSMDVSINNGASELQNAECTNEQRRIEGICANPIVVTLSSTALDPSIAVVSDSEISVEVEANIEGVVKPQDAVIESVKTNILGEDEDIAVLVLNPSGTTETVVKFWPSRLKLERIHFCLGHSIHKLKSMGNYKFSSGLGLFMFCNDLIEISNVAEFSDSLKEATNFSMMFAHSNLNQSLEGLKTSQVVNMEGLFEGATAYNQVLPASFDTSNVTNMRNMFSGAESYNQALPVSFNTSKVTDMGGMFSGAKAYDQVLPASFDTSNVTNMRNMFSGAESYNQTLPVSFNTSKVTDMGMMFSGATAYDQVLPASFDTSNVTDMWSMFSGAESYNQALPASFNTSKVTDMGGMFSEAKAYDQVFPASFDTSKVENMGAMFWGATAFDQDLKSSFNVCKVINDSGFSTDSGLSIANTPSFNPTQGNKGGPCTP